MGYPKYSEDIAERNLECWDRVESRRQAMQRKDAVSRAAGLNMRILSSSGPGRPPLRRCPTWAEPGGNVRICQDCGAAFSISWEDMAHYENTHQPLPTHCKTCRQKRQEKRRRRNELRRAANSGILQDLDARQR